MKEPLNKTRYVSCYEANSMAAAADSGYECSAILSGVIVRAADGVVVLDDGTAVCEACMMDSSFNCASVRIGDMVDMFINVTAKLLLGTGIFRLQDPNFEALRILQQLPQRLSSSLASSTKGENVVPVYDIENVQVYSELKPETLSNLIITTGAQGATLEELAERARVPLAALGPMLEDLQEEGLVYCVSDKFFPL
jgi:hypothetical protein